MVTASLLGLAPGFQAEHAVKPFDIPPAVHYQGAMRAGRIIRRSLLAGLVVVVLAVGVVFLLASRIPSSYRPARLSPAEQERLASAWKVRDGRVRGFMGLLADFDDAGSGRPFAWTITQEEANLCLASVDGIASLGWGAPVFPMAELERAGFSEPAVAMRAGVLTLMVRSSTHGKILSVDVGFAFEKEGNLRMEIRAMRVGVMPVPKALFEDELQRLREDVQALLGDASAVGRGRHYGALSAEDVAKFMRVAVGMLDGKAVRPEIRWPLGADHRVLVKKVEINKERLTLHIEPVGWSARTAISPSRGDER